MSIKSKFKDLCVLMRNLLGKPYVQVGIIVFLLVLLSFGLGYLMGRDFNPSPIIIQNGA